MGISSTEPRFSLTCTPAHTKGIPSEYSWHWHVAETTLLCSSYLGNKAVVKQLAHLILFPQFPSMHTPQPNFLHSVQLSPQLFLSPLGGHHSVVGLVSTPRSPLWPTEVSPSLPTSPMLQTKIFHFHIISRMLGPLHRFLLFTSVHLYAKERGTVWVCFPSW